MQKKCYGLIITTDGKQKYLYEDPYTYIEKIGCKPIRDYFGFLENLPEEEIKNCLYTNGTDIDYNVLFYSKDGDMNYNNPDNINAEAFCNAYIWRINPLTCIDFPVIYDDMIILPKNKSKINKKDREKLKQYLENTKQYLSKGEQNG